MAFNQLFLDMVIDVMCGRLRCPRESLAHVCSYDAHGSHEALSGDVGSPTVLDEYRSKSFARLDL
eukprot:3637616-Amphidinium_carterae.1